MKKTDSYSQGNTVRQLDNASISYQPTIGGNGETIAPWNRTGMNGLRLDKNGNTTVNGILNVSLTDNTILTNNLYGGL